MGKLNKQRGKWLEHFLNPATRVDDHYTGAGKVPGFRSLARDALDILGVTEKYALDDDPALKALDAILKAPPGVQKFYDFDNIEFYCQFERDSFNKLAKYDCEWTEKVIKEKDPLKLVSTGLFYIFDELIGDYEENFFLKQFFLIDEVYRVFMDQFNLKRLFKILSGEAMPWGQALYKSRLEDKRWFDFEIKDHYGLFEKICENNEKQEITFKFELKYSDENGLIFPWKCVSINIALDFLKHGGQDRFCFCENCGRFVFIERTGKKYCSANCRTRARQASLQK